MRNNSSFMPKTKIFSLVLTTTFVALTVLACSDDDDAAGGGGDVAGSCDTMCKGAGFTSSRVDQQPNETNCFCTGTGTITADACTNMCKSVGKPGQPFGSGAGVTSANSCQCQ